MIIIGAPKIFNGSHYLTMHAPMRDGLSSVWAVTCTFYL